MRNLAPSSLTALPFATHHLADLETAFNARHSQLRAIAEQAQGYTFRHGNQPRDGRGRFLPLKWLLAAESYSVADLAFFRSPIGAV